MTTPPEHDALIAAGYTAKPHPSGGGRIDYRRASVWLTYFADGFWVARADGEWLGRQGAKSPTAAAALADVRKRLAVVTDDLLALVASATPEPLP